MLELHEGLGHIVIHELQIHQSMMVVHERDFP